MNVTEYEQVLLVLTVAPSLEDAMIDWLLDSEHQSGFTSIQVAGHSTRHDQLSTVEQVTGRQRRVQFQIQLDARKVDAFMDGLFTAFRSVDLHHWIQPIYSRSR